MSPRVIDVVVLDGAGWHPCGALVVPENLRLLVLPPYSPELNALERVFQYLRAHRFANRVFPTVAAAQEACAAAWEWLCSTPEQVASILRHGWFKVSQAANRQTGVICMVWYQSAAESGPAATRVAW